MYGLDFLKKQAREGFRPPSAMKRIGYFQKKLRFFWDFLGDIFLEDFFWRVFLGGFFIKDFFGRIFWGEFFGRNYLVEINKELTFLSRFWGNFVSIKEGRRKEGGRILDP